ncbi:DUF7118 family protein [Salinilacihabitans rarus]|uniref:DUF7118 family protein n=1 Tax=Salinilacihabitans rarus TaxID=2961596 RepID=UPI0020C87692|nr:hypothetical protein [Salinilacihabitans rarus]
MSETRQRDDPAARLERARQRLADVEERIDDRGADTVERVADAYRTASDLLDEYVDRATGTGRETFKAYVQLEGQFESLVESLPEDLPRREAFGSALEAIDKRRLHESDFERAEAALEPAATFADLVDERETAREELAVARTEASKRRRAVDDEIAERERLLDLATADLDAPVDRLREPIEAYDAAIREAFERYRDAASAREVFALLDRSRWYPFVPFERPPAELREYVETNPAGEYSIPDLLEYADYSRSKLDHYVDDADELKRRVATRRTYLTGIDAGPLTVGWPPGPATVLRHRARELRPFVDRVADEEVVAALREVRALTRDDEYERLRTAAVARDRLSPEERERLADGRVADELEELRTERDRLEELLAVEDPV